MLPVILLLTGFLPLIFGAGLLVDGASAVARRLKVPAIVIGMTLVAFGTSMPELVVNLFASARGQDQLVVGNILGSNIFNIMMILGISSVIHRLPINRRTTWIEIPLAFTAALALWAAASDRLLDKAANNLLSRSDGILLLLFFAVFLGYLLSLLRQEPGKQVAGEAGGLGRAAAKALGGLLLLLAGGQLVVGSAEKVALLAGVSERIVALTVVAVGTSLPELVTSITATAKGEYDLAVGNVIGSNIFNIFFILGLSGVVRATRLASSFTIDFAACLLATLLTFVFVFTGKDRALERWEGVLLLLGYLAYCALVFLWR
jgi:cation:H+ antiporter